MKYTKDKKDQKRAENTKYIHYYSKQRVTSKLIWIMDDLE